MEWKRSFNYLFILIVLSVTNGEEDDNLIVELPNGKLKGKDRGFYYSYESIPYAKAPIGDLRFEPPQAYKNKWTDIFDATKAPIACLQWNPLKGGENKLEGSEDCLFVNVYKPKTAKEKYPVIADIHGGGFMFGSTNMLGADLLMKSGETIVVKFAYRLGPLGFLSTEDDAISGNNGLKDQQLALKWIKENIQHFGGDCEKILLMGFSAGGASTHLQMLNPYLENIAKAAISVSGTALNPWVITKNPKERALKLAEHLQCPDLTNTEAIKHCLKQKEANEIVASVKKFLNFGMNPFTIFSPVVEHKNAAHAFITDHPRDIINSGKYSHLPWLATYVHEDGGFNAAELLQINPKTGEPFINDLNDKWLELAPQNLFLVNIQDDPQSYAQQLRDDYMGNLTFSEENYMRVQELYTDILFKNGIIEALKLHSHHSKAPVYGYIYDNPPNFNMGNVLANKSDYKFGTVHFDDILLMMSFALRPLTPDEEVISQKFIKMLEDFAKEGNLSFGDCKLENNAGSSDAFKFLLITKDSCEHIEQ